MKLTRYSDNPIITPTNNWWEIQATFNPGATIYNDKVLLLYRAIGGDGFSRFGKAISADGFVFERFAEPIFEAELENPLERLGVEDPRIAKIDDTYYIIYTEASVYQAKAYKEKKFAPSLSHPAPWRVRPGLVTTKDFKNFERKGILLDIDTKDAALFPEKINGQFVLLHRIYPNMIITYSDDMKNWHSEKILISPRPEFWDAERVGAGATPIRTKSGWLNIYHGIDSNHRYMLGVLLLDLTDPTKVLYRSEDPILEPQEDYEMAGLTPNVVFTCGVIEKGGVLLVYYGAADKVIGVATIETEKLLNSL